VRHLHADILDPPPKEELPALPEAEEGLKAYEAAMNRKSERATELYGNCLKLRLLTPIMAEAYINMIILMFCRDKIRKDAEQYQMFLREKVPRRLALLSQYCYGFTRAIDTTTDAYANFMRVIDKRNFALHGNVDPVNPDHQCNIRVMDDSDFSSYRSGGRHHYYGGLYNRLPARITVPYDGNWNTTIDLGGGRANIRYSINYLKRKAA
jgi:hypothetical protein